MHYPDLTRSLDGATLSLVGLTPLLAVCTTLASGLAMGLAYLAALLLSSLTVSCSRRFLPARTGLIYLLLVSAAWVSAIDILMQAGCHALREQLGIYLSLLAMNTSLLLHLEGCPLRMNSGATVPAGPVTALTGAALLAVTGLLRELAAGGGVLTDLHLLFPVAAPALPQPVYLFDGGLHLFGAHAGAFIIFGLLLAVLSHVTRPAGREAADS